MKLKIMAGSGAEPEERQHDQNGEQERESERANSQ